MGIEIFDKYADVRTAGATRPTPSQSPVQPMFHGLTTSEIMGMKDRFEKFVPNIASTLTASRSRDMFTEDLPLGANWSERTAQTFMPNTSGGLPGGGRQMITVPTPYQPEFASPDRQQYPVHRILANRYWRLFYKLDPVIGNCVELYSDLPWSNFELTGEGVEGEIRQAYEYMCRETQVLAMLPYFVREFLVVGEAVPHTFFDNSKGVFTYIALHNPDQLEVVDAPFIKMEPIVEFIPDDRLRAVLTSDQPSLRKLRERMPPELLQRLFSKQNIPLSPINATFIPRKLHPYDTRGTSLLSRLWRVLMLEDAVFNATIQTARRHAAPIKVAKLGNAATGWIPPPEQEKRLLELLTQAELDPNAWLVYHYGIQFEAIGTTDRVMSVNREWDIIERIKLVALGISKAFLHGEVSYASSATGLQVFLQRLKTLRMFFEQKWLYPKFFRPIAEMNGWVKPKPTEITHRYRVKRSAQELEEQNAYIIPKIVWDKSLDPQINTELINAMTALEAMGVRFSKTSKMASVGYSFEEETKKIHREQEFEKAFLPGMPQAPAAGGEGGAPMAGGGAPPPGSPTPGGDDGKAPPGSEGVQPPGVNPPPGPPKPPGANLQVTSDEGQSVTDSDKPKPSRSTNDKLRSEIWVDDKYGNWKADEISDLLDLIHTLDTASAFWAQLGADKEFKRALLTHNMDIVWDCVDQYLQKQGYPDSDIDELRHVLEHEGLLVGDDATQRLKQLEDGMPDDVGSLNDEQYANVVANLIKKNSGKITTDQTKLLSGHDVPMSSSLLGDVSDLMPNK